jgi:hypothetical protein
MSPKLPKDEKFDWHTIWSAHRDAAIRGIVQPTHWEVYWKTTGDIFWKTGINTHNPTYDAITQFI